MTTKNIKILAIETSCDETAAAVIGEENNQPVILSNIISSSVALHAKTGGIVPEVASREQMKFMIPVVSEALLNSAVCHSRGGGNPGNKEWIPDQVGDDNYFKSIKLLDDITHIAVTAGPGLIGSLLVGFNAAKTLAYARDLPIIPINHIEGHIYSAFGGENSKLKDQNSNQYQNSNVKNSNPDLSFELGTLSFPLIALTVSGGHTMLVLMRDHGKYEVIGQTIDDAVGEAYDKVARLLGLGYPGGPKISKLAKQFRDKFTTPNPSSGRRGDMTGIVFPRPIMKDGTFNFSFSGLKTAVLVKVKKIMAENNLDNAADIDLEVKEEISAAFEEAVADVLAFKLGKAVEKYQPKSVLFAGGVSANQYLVESLKLKVNPTSPRLRGARSIRSHIEFLTPPPEMSGDNAAMIGLAAYYHIQRGDVSDWKSVKVDANLKLV